MEWDRNVILIVVVSAVFMLIVAMLGLYMVRAEEDDKFKTECLVRGGVVVEYQCYFTEKAGNQ
jgi:hypothetical protein